jgi:hypothetical protein
VPETHLSAMCCRRASWSLSITCVCLLQGKVKGMDEEEAKRQFFQSAISQQDGPDVDTALLKKAKPRYSRSVHNMMCVMDDMFHAIVESINGAPPALLADCPASWHWHCAVHQLFA